MKKIIMKKLVLLSLSAVAALAVSMNAAVADSNSTPALHFPDVTQAAEIKAVGVYDPFDGITLSKEQKEKLDLIITAVKNTRVEGVSDRKDLNRKTMYQIKKVLTAEQYVKFLENIADAQMSLTLS